MDDRHEIVNITKDDSVKASFRQGDMTFAVGTTRFHVINWIIHQAKNHPYDEIASISASSNGSAFTDLKAPQVIGSISISLKSGEVIAIESTQKDLTDFNDTLITTRYNAAVNHKNV